MELLQQKFNCGKLMETVQQNGHILEAKNMKIMFICTGNICRSAMAEWYLKRIAKERNMNIEVYSSGIYGEEGAGASYLAKEAMSEYDVNLDKHVATVTSKSNIKEMDLILCATLSHKRILIQMYPELQNKKWSEATKLFQRSLSKYFCEKCGTQAEAAKKLGCTTKTLQNAMK